MRDKGGVSIDGTLTRAGKCKLNSYDPSNYFLDYEDHVAIQYDPHDDTVSNKEEKEQLTEKMFVALNKLERICYDADIAITKIKATGMWGKSQIVRSIGMAVYNLLELIPESVRTKEAVNLRRNYAEKMGKYRNTFG
jgi:hypothetical protein